MTTEIAISHYLRGIGGDEIHKHRPYSKTRLPIYLLYLYKLAQLTSSERKILLNYELKNELSWVNFNTYKRILNWQPFMNRVCCFPANLKLPTVY